MSSEYGFKTYLPGNLVCVNVVDTPETSLLSWASLLSKNGALQSEPPGLIQNFGDSQIAWATEFENIRCKNRAKRFALA